MEDLKDYVVANPGNLVAAMVDSWVDKSRLMLDFEEAEPDRCYRIRYEDVVLRPAQALPPLFEFLGVEWDPELPQRVFSTPHDLGAGDPKVHFTGVIDPSYVGKGKQIHYGEIPAAQRERMNELLRRLGYPEVGEDWNDTPEPAEPAAVQETADDGGPATVREVFEQHVPAMMERNAGELPRSTSPTVS